MNQKNMSIILVLFLGFFMVTSNIIIVAPILKFIKTDLSIPRSYLGFVLAAFPFMAIISNIILGPFIDKYGRRRMMLIGSTACIAIFFLTSTATNAMAIIVYRMLTALFIPMVGASIFPYVIDYFKKEDRMKIMGYVMSASYMAAIISIPLGILASGFFSWRFIFYGMAFIALIVSVSTLFILPKPEVELSQDKIVFQTYKKKFLSFSKDRNVIFNLLTKFLSTVGIFAFAGLYPTWLFDTFTKVGVTYTDVAILFLFCGIAGWIASVLSGKVSSKVINKTYLFGVLAIISGVATFITPMYTKIFYFQHLIYVSVVFSRAMFSPILQTMLIQSVKPSERGSLNGVNNAVFQIGTASGVAFGGYLYAIQDSFIFNGLTAAIFLSSSAIVFMVFVKEKTESQVLSTQGIQTKSA